MTVDQLITAHPDADLIVRFDGCQVTITPTGQAAFNWLLGCRVAEDHVADFIRMIAPSRFNVTVAS